MANLDSLTPGSEEETDSIFFDKMPKLNLPPKPVRASTVAVLDTATLKTMPSIQKTVPAPPSLSSNALDFNEPLVEEKLSSKSISPFLSLSTAVLAILAALIALIVQLFIFFSFLR